MSFVVGPARRLVAHVLELLAQVLQRHAVLQGERNGCRKRIHQARDGRAFLRHLDEDFAWLAVVVEAHRDVAFVAADGELVGERSALVGQAGGASACRRPSPRSSWRPCPCSGAALSSIRRGRWPRLSVPIATTRGTLPPMSSTVDSSGMLIVFEIAPETNGCTAAIMRMWPRYWMERVPFWALKLQSNTLMCSSLRCGAPSMVPVESM